MKAIRRIVRDVPQHWVGDGFPVRSLFSYREARDFDPFLLLDYAGPHRFAPAEVARGVGEHPHRGFETVTIVYQGELEHRDSSGSHGTIGPGDVQWMTAAAGIVHEELHSQRFVREGGVLEMIQLWVNLPARDKSSPPRYQNLTAGMIPRVALPDGAGSLRVIAGAFQNTTGAATTFTPINLWDIELSDSGAVELQLPAGHTAMLVVQAGAVELGSARLAATELALLEREETRLPLRAEQPTRLLLLSGKPIEEPVVGQGPFVMNSREEILQAIADYQAGRMGQLA